MDKPLVIASSPHIRAEMSTQKIMANVIGALIPAGLASIYFFGPRAAAIVAVCVASCVISEAAWQKLSGGKITVSDLSATLTGLLLAYNLPPSVPLWMGAIGGVFAMIIVKHFFGGLGQNIVNPALAGRAVMLSCWPVAMTTWTTPWVDGVSGPTPLAVIKLSGGALPRLADMFIGRIGGCIGETSSIALLLGGAYLIWKGIISWRIPAVYIITVAVLSALFGRSGGPVVEILSGGLILGAFFMATDYATCPMTPPGQIVFAFGCGLIASLIRTFGGYPEGVSYSILIMNLAVPIIDRLTPPRVLGEAKRHASK
ncbi:MAG: RnfABCDGE type electron transport complex subunit D [Synergistaceae bacterium]|jgi:electron transport complex protein RnfD|nr:RnfABCDGE type electron transport complex subunit D [Synergistaceae bacterium]